MSKQDESPAVPPRTEGNATNKCYDFKPHKGCGYRMPWGLVQRLLGFCGGKGNKTEHDAAALLIDFHRDCYGNYSEISTECLVCPPGYYCKPETIAKKQRREP